MGFDTELGLAWEAPRPTASLRNARLDLLAEHCGLPRARAHELLGAPAGLVARLDELARDGRHRLRLHRRNADEHPRRHAVRSRRSGAARVPPPRARPVARPAAA
jgi:hypothetical protein